jgi:hypothetical protein
MCQARHGWYECSDLLFYLFANGFSGHLQVVGCLKIQPEFGRSTEEKGNTQRGISRNGAGAIQDGGYPVGGHVQRLGKGIGGHVNFGELFLQHLAGMYGAHGIHGVSPFNDSQQSLRCMGRLPAIRSKYATAGLP